MTTPFRELALAPLPLDSCLVEAKKRCLSHLSVASPFSKRLLTIQLRFYPLNSFRYFGRVVEGRPVREQWPQLF
jgi:hypothetical protein